MARANNEEVYEINVLVNLALIHERQSQYQEAADCLESALSLDPANHKIGTKLQQLRALA